SAAPAASQTRPAPGRPWPRGAPVAMRRRSTALSTSRAAARCGGGRSRRGGANAPAGMTYKARGGGVEAPPARPPWLRILAGFAHHLRHRPRQLRELVLPNRERRREIDDGAERADEHPLLHEPCAQDLEIVDAVKLHNADRTLHPHVLDAWKAATGRKA